MPGPQAASRQRRLRRQLRTKAKEGLAFNEPSTLPRRDHHGMKCLEGCTTEHLPRNLRRAQDRLAARQGAFIPGSGFRRPGSMKMG